MTELKTIVRRSTSARRHEKSRTRCVMLSLEPPASVGVRLAGTRQTYRLEAESIYELAVRAHERAIERRAVQIRRNDPTCRSITSARAKARRELAKELRADLKSNPGNPVTPVTR